MSSKIYIDEGKYLEVHTSIRENWIGEFTGRWRIDTREEAGEVISQTLWLEVKTGILIPFLWKTWISEEKIWPFICYDTIHKKGEIQNCDNKS